jgi:16S rRNA (uracil1498-N3)-methyltransferase
VRRIWLALDQNTPADFRSGDTFELRDEPFHHAVVVSRLSKGEKFEALSGYPEILQLEIVDVGKKSATVSVIGHRKLPLPAKPKINVALSICKWDTCEWVIEKSVELGVDTFLPIVSENSFIKKVNDMPEARLKRWQKLVESATVQTARGSLMKIQPPMQLATFLKEINQKPASVCLFAYEGAREIAVRTELQKLLQKAPDEVWALVGSEGGFSAAEAKSIEAAGLQPATLGEQILRAETACLTMVSIIKYEAGLFR